MQAPVRNTADYVLESIGSYLALSVFKAVPAALSDSTLHLRGLGHFRSWTRMYTN